MQQPHMFLEQHQFSFASFSLPYLNTFFNRTFTLQRHLTTCSERVKHIYSRNVHPIQNTHLDKLDCFSINYTSRRKLFKNLAIFKFESICVQVKTFKDTKIKTWTGNHVLISVFISSNLVEEPLFLYNSFSCNFH